MRYLLLCLALTAPAPIAQAESLFDFVQRAQAKPAIAESTTSPAKALAFGAPPRESREESERLYRPIAEYLSRALGRPVGYRYPMNWGAYRTDVLRDVYDLSFDEPHFNSYRVEKQGHHVLVKFPGTLQYAVIISYLRMFTGIHRMAGHTFCTFAPPNLGTLVLLDLLDNPSRQPVIVPINRWEEAFDGVNSGRCAGGVLPLALLRRLDPEGRGAKVLFNSTELPAQAISAGPRISPYDREIITKALLAPAAAAPTAALRRRWSAPQGFVPANSDEYADLSSYLRKEPGFY